MHSNNRPRRSRIKGPVLWCRQSPCHLLLMHSPEVELTEIFVSNIFNGCWISQDGCIRGYMVYPIERALEH